MIVTQRHVIISSYSSNNISGCMYKVYFDPRAALKGPIDAYQLSQYSLICRKIPAILTIGKNNKILATQERTEGQCALNNLTAYFIITGPFYTSWQEAAEICSTIGAHLPKIITDDERILLENLMLGSVFNQSRKVRVLIRCRILDLVCGVFLGLNGSMVNSSTINSYIL